jgi:hypothetical protein
MGLRFPRKTLKSACDIHCVAQHRVFQPVGVAGVADNDFPIVQAGADLDRLTTFGPPFLVAGRGRCRPLIPNDEEGLALDAFYPIPGSARAIGPVLVDDAFQPEAADMLKQDSRFDIESFR